MANCRCKRFTEGSIASQKLRQKKSNLGVSSGMDLASVTLHSPAPAHSPSTTTPPLQGCLFLVASCTFRTSVRVRPNVSLRIIWSELIRPCRLRRIQRRTRANMAMEDGQIGTNRATNKDDWESIKARLGTDWALIGLVGRWMGAGWALVGRWLGALRGTNRCTKGH